MNSSIHSVSKPVQKFSEFDFQIFQLQSEIEFIKSQRLQFCQTQTQSLETEVAKFQKQWESQISCLAPIQFKNLENGIRLVGSSCEGTRYYMHKYSSHLKFEFEKHELDFVINKKEQSESLNPNHFATHHYRITHDALTAINKSFEAIDSLFPILVEWDESMIAFTRRIENSIAKLNHKLAVFDNKLESLREEIKSHRSQSLLAGNIIDFSTESYRKFYYSSRHFEFFEKLQIVHFSDSGKTCTIRATIREKKFRGTSYYPIRESQIHTEFQKVRVKTLIQNLYEKR